MRKLIALSLMLLLSSPFIAFTGYVGALRYSNDTDLGNVDASFLGEKSNDWVGYHVSMAGDINGDGYDDSVDEYPLDSSRWKKEDEPVPVTSKPKEESSNTGIIISAIMIIFVVAIIFIFLFILKPNKERVGEGEVKLDNKRQPTETRKPQNRINKNKNNQLPTFDHKPEP